eukprot:11519120-Heterocapsa_arctica.AAC.1
MVSEHYPWHSGLAKLCEVFQQHFRWPDVDQTAECNFQSHKVTFSVPKVVCTVTINPSDVKGKTKVLHRVKPPARGKACLF